MRLVPVKRGLLVDAHDSPLGPRAGAVGPGPRAGAAGLGPRGLPSRTGSAPAPRSDCHSRQAGSREAGPPCRRRAESSFPATGPTGKRVPVASLLPDEPGATPEQRIRVFPVKHRCLRRRHSEPPSGTRTQGPWLTASRTEVSTSGSVRQSPANRRGPEVSAIPDPRKAELAFCVCALGVHPTVTIDMGTTRGSGRSAPSAIATPLLWGPGSPQGRDDGCTAGTRGAPRRRRGTALVGPMPTLRVCLSRSTERSRRYVPDTCGRR